MYSFLQVSDFGLSRRLALTSAVKMRGTLLWAAPEVLTEQRQSLKSDTWSFGCTVVEMLSEKDPYHHKHQGDSKEMNRVLRQVEDLQLVSINEVNFDVRILSFIRT